jgi:osmoprotectant transport system permease protein
MGVVSATVAWLTDPANWSGPSGIPVRVGEHLALSLVALLAAALIALPIGLWVGHTGRGGRVAVNVANIGRAVPSLALIGVLIPFTVMIDPQLGFKVLPTLIAMVALAIPPILVNAYTGIDEVDRDLTEAARGMGMTEAGVLRRVELPLAVPVIAAGLGSAAVQIIATATLGAIFGFGGLGTYLTEGISQNNQGMIWGGVVLVAILALAAEATFTLLARALTSPGVSTARVRPVREPGAMGRGGGEVVGLP